jgi:L-alanine-DL-glutamate epimerase-like enolase superfamily enzyme
MEFGDYLINEPLVIADGRVAAPTAPGIGATVDEAKLAAYRLDKE